jgi:Secretion system C-terminal sorting domain
MKRKLQITSLQAAFAVICFCFVQTNAVFSQTISEWRSAASGDFANAGGTLWEKNVLGAWTVQAAAAKPSGSSNVTIRNGHTVTLSATTSIMNLTIESGATFNSTAAVTAPITLRVGASSTADITAGFINNIVVIQNDGVFGDPAGTKGGINLEVAKECRTLTLQGTGTCNIGRTRFLYPNANSPATFNINQSMNLGLAGSGSFTAYYNNAANTATENNVINLAAGKTVTLVSGGSFHGGVSSTAPTANPQGTMTYNIAGTLDLSATTSGGLQTSTNTTGAASLNLNIKNGGIMKLGTSFAAYRGGTNGSINMTIESGGIVDGSALTSGVTNNSSALNTGSTWFTIQGTGVLKQAVGTSAVTFPIGTDATHYNPVTLTNGGGNVFTATVVAGNAPSGLADATKALNRTWNITPTTTPATADINFGFNTGDGNASCVLTDPMSLQHHTGSAWESLGTATPSVPSSGTTNYQVGYSGITSFSPFTLMNLAQIPVELMTFKGYAKGNTNELTWATASERNNAAFIVERSSNGIDFQSIGTVKGKGNSSAVSNYTFTDLGPLSINYYRLRQMDTDGKETLSKTVTIADRNKQGILKTYPSVTDAVLSIDYAATGDVTFKVLDILGKTVLSLQVKNNDGLNTTQLDVSALASGMYILSFESATMKMVQKFEKR